MAFPRHLLGVALLGFLVGVNILIFREVFVSHELRVSILNIGQGDSILVEGPTGVVMLVDGGPDRSVLRELGEALPFSKRTIDVVVETHPDRDHIGGLPDVFANYQVSYFFEPGIPDGTRAAAALAAAVSGETGLQQVIARRGMRLDLGGGAYADILYPDRDVSKMDTNSGSITMHVVYGKTSFMLTGDLTSPIEGWLTALDARDGKLQTNILKAGHHGSKYSTSDGWLASLHPEVVAISVGAHNSYGHPTPEVLSRVSAEGARVFRTDQDGRIIFVSDGTHVYKK